MGAGTDAVRKWVARGTVEHEGADDTVYEGLDDGHDGGATYRHDNNANGGGAAELLESFRDQLDAHEDQAAYLRSPLSQELEARRRADTIIAQPTRANAALAQRVPELQAPQMHREADRGAAEDATGVHEQDYTGDPRGPERPRDTAEFPVRGSLTRPWWRRAFGG